MANETTNERDDFFACLRQDHARIEVRIRALERAAASVWGEATGRVTGDAPSLEVIADTLRFFASEGARHEAHEEQTLFPRLRTMPEFKQILSALRFQHEMNAAEGRALSECLAHFGPGSERELRRLVHRFAEMNRGHAIAEERALFPLAATMLPPQIVAEMGREMQALNRAAGVTGEHSRPDGLPSRAL